MKPPAPDLAVICPVFNEEGRASETIPRLVGALGASKLTWEAVLVNDGSTDHTETRVLELMAQYPGFRLVGYPRHAGRGQALREGFQASTGNIVVTLDFDLSYRESIVLALYEALQADPGAGIALASVHMPGGRAVGVPFHRLLLSRWSNFFIRHAFRSKIRTWTCIVRAYRREVLEALDLTSTGKEIHVEILAQAIARGVRVVEIPATLEGRIRPYPPGRFLRDAVRHLQVLVRLRRGLRGQHDSLGF
ncbi:MAG: glycosyltransferase [Planctomycetes bacterium]|nr:glycosyltransferase [Planctomycetota bacterium]